VSKPKATAERLRIADLAVELARGEIKECRAARDKAIA
jgi:hypothetical protein